MMRSTDSFPCQTFSWSELLYPGIQTGEYPTHYVETIGSFLIHPFQILWKLEHTQSFPSPSRQTLAFCTSSAGSHLSMLLWGLYSSLSPRLSWSKETDMAIGYSSFKKARLAFLCLQWNSCEKGCQRLIAFCKLEKTYLGNTICFINDFNGTCWMQEIQDQQFA